jgi:hypothetical protein
MRGAPALAPHVPTWEERRAYRAVSAAPSGAPGEETRAARPDAGPERNEA